MTMPTHIVAVGGIVENEQGHILLVKTEHGGWVFPGGQVEAGENLMDALIREVKEESGIDVAVSCLIGVYSNTAIHKWHDGVTVIPTKVILDFMCKSVGGELCPSEETSESRWFEKDKVLDMVTAPAIRDRYQVYLDFGGGTCYMEYITVDGKVEKVSLESAEDGSPIGDSSKEASLEFIHELLSLDRRLEAYRLNCL